MKPEKPDGPYHDRREAGRILAAHVAKQIGLIDDALVLGLPRGGVPVAHEVAQYLDAELGVFVVRKLGAPGHDEYAIGALATGGFRLLNYEAIAQLGLSDRDVTAVTEREKRELRRREELYGQGMPPRRTEGRAVLLVDDGLATGFSMRVAVRALRERHPRQLVVGVPVGAPETCREIEREVDTLVCPLRPEEFHAVGQWYLDFTPTPDDEVRAALRAGAIQHAARTHRR